MSGAGVARLEAARRIVVKIGSALLVDGRDGRIRRAWLNALADDLAVMDRGRIAMAGPLGDFAEADIRRHLTV